ncbi:MAG: hypothetical protein ACRETX_06605 [Steroidobacteraceae bacterium]
MSNNAESLRFMGAPLRASSKARAYLAQRPHRAILAPRVAQSDNKLANRILLGLAIGAARAQ